MLLRQDCHGVRHHCEATTSLDLNLSDCGMVRIVGYGHDESGEDCCAGVIVGKKLSFERLAT